MNGVMDPTEPTDIYRLRQRLGLSMRDMGRLLSVSKTTVWNWEHGEGRPNEMRRQILRQLDQETQHRRRTEEWGQFLVSLAVGAGIGAVLGTIFKNMARERDPEEEHVS